MKVPIYGAEISTSPTKANSTERGGRKVSDLQPMGQGSGIAEVVEVRLRKAPPPMSNPGREAAWIHTLTQEVGIKSIMTRTGIGNNHWSAVLNQQIKGK
jgi:hypothetical protein